MPLSPRGGSSKSFGDKQVVDGLDLFIPRGSFYGIAGPNGAGKTTTIRMVTGLLRPDAGEIGVDGVAVWPDPREAKSALGYCPPTSPTSSELSTVSSGSSSAHPMRRTPSCSAWSSSRGRPRRSPTS